MIYVYTDSPHFRQLMPFATLEEAVAYVEKSKREHELDDDQAVRYIDGVEVTPK